ncbi:cytochrome P450 [Numidum massiliense]|uniref:cytochrome P450 n=1 Tax=Numidum massiliense TaxID=1522315 RepID=UPI0006D55300|nr:cytochrome P450 [Numidum massiliense]
MDAAQLTGPTGLLLTGNLLAFRKDPLAYLMKTAHDYGEIARLRFGLKQNVYLINSPDDIHEILVKKQDHFHKTTTLKIAKVALGAGLLTSEGEAHMRQRRLMAPAFARKHIGTYADTMVNYASQEIAAWQDGEERDINRAMMEITLSVITETMFGTQISQGFRQVAEAIEMGMRYITERARAIVYLPEEIPTPKSKKFHEAITGLNKVIYEIIEERRQHPELNERGDLLATLLRARDEDDGSGMTDEQVRDQVFTIFMAGHETTANTLSWVFYLLAKHPEIVEKLEREVDDVLQGRLPTLDDYDKLTYVQHVISETLRLYPAAWKISREVVSTVEIGSHQFVPGEILLMSQYVMHRNPRFYDDPADFRPERFAGDMLKRIPKFAYFPFGGGARICIGNHFALLEAALVLATIVQKFRLSLPEDRQEVKPEPLITLRPQGGLPMVVSAR